MRRLLAVLLISTFSWSASAKINAVPLVHDGFTGVWLRDDDAMAVLDAAQRSVAQRDVIETQDKLIGVLQLQVRTATTALAETSSYATELEQENGALKRDLADAVSERDSLLHDPFLWLAIGVLGGAAVAAGTTALVFSLSK